MQGSPNPLEEVDSRITRTCNAISATLTEDRPSQPPAPCPPLGRALRPLGAPGTGIELAVGLLFERTDLRGTSRAGEGKPKKNIDSPAT